MGLINRDNDASEAQRKYSIAAQTYYGTTAIPTGTTLYCGTIVERACQIQQVQATCFGISGAPQILLGALRFSATTSFVIGTTMAIPSFGVSGYMAYSLGTAGDTRLNLAKGDILVAQQLGGSGAASLGTVIDIVVKDLQDIRTWY